jgi:Na+(H+)/acetate symporter ActP
MSKILAWFASLPASEPAALSYGLAAALVPVLTLTLHWDTRQTAAAAAILTALASAVAALKARPVAPTALIGGAVAIVEALAAFHVNVPAADLSVYSGFATAVLGLILRAHLTPVTNQPGAIPED